MIDEPVTKTPGPDATRTRVLIIGTGFAGLAMAAQLTRQGMDDFLVLERADEVGGTWRDNTHPGCACDVPSLLFGFAVNPKILKRAEKLAVAHLEEAVADPELRRQMTPHYDMGCKRILLSNDYLPSLTRADVTVETSGIAEVRTHSILAADGTEHPVDTIIFGTGFQVTEMPAAAHIWGSGGVRLADHWAETAAAYLGTSVAGFPNLFFIVGPNTGLGHTSMVFMIESQVAYILDALRAIDRDGASVIAVRPEVQDAYNDELQERLATTVWNTGGCSSWYLDARGRNTSLWPTFTFVFRRRTRRFDPADYVVQPPRAGRVPVPVDSSPTVSLGARRCTGRTRTRRSPRPSPETR